MKNSTFCFMGFVVCIIWVAGGDRTLRTTVPGGQQMNVTGCHFDTMLKASGGIDGWRLLCLERDTLTGIPVISPRISASVLSIVIKNQPRLTRLRKTDMTPFRRLRKFSLTDSGLMRIEREAFTKNPLLERIDLRANALQTLDWRSLVGPAKASLDVRQNPFLCNCSIYWLAAWNTQVAKRREITSPDGSRFELSPAFLLTLPGDIVEEDDLECMSLVDGRKSKMGIRDWAFMNGEMAEQACKVPEVNMYPRLISAVEGGTDSVRFSCSIKSAQPLDDVFSTVLLKIVDSNETRFQFHTERHYENGALIVNISMENVTRSVMGWYVCIGASESGPQFDMSPVLVESKPEIRVISNELVNLEVGQMSNIIEFSIIAYPPPSRLEWVKNNVSFDIHDETNAPVFTVKRGEERVKRRGHAFFIERISLTVRLIFTYEFYEGDYGLRACNKYGCDQVTFTSYRNSSWFHRDTATIMTPTIVGSAVENGPQKTELVWIIAVAFTSCGLILCGIYFLRRWVRGRKGSGGQWRRRQMTRNLNFDGDGFSFPLTTYTPNAVYEPLLSAGVPVVPMASLEIMETLGEGAFGEVYLAYCHLSPAKRASGECETPTAVAAKRLKQFSSTECNQDFIHEAELMAKLSHPNVVTFFGVCLRGRDDLLLLYEYMDLGDLKKFLALHGPCPELMNAPADTWRLTPDHQTDIARQVALGLAYLHQCHFVHRDLASRNCLVNSDLQVKLSDFGMSRDVYSSDYYRLTHKAPLPVRWLPPEALCYGRFSDMSDVWSYGVVVWEIAAFGEQPWRGYSNVEVMQKVGAGDVLIPPQDCPLVLRDIMVECWKRTPCERIKLDEVINLLTKVH